MTDQQMSEAIRSMPEKDQKVFMFILENPDLLNELKPHYDTQSLTKAGAEKFVEKCRKLMGSQQ